MGTQLSRISKGGLPSKNSVDLVNSLLDAYPGYYTKQMSDQKRLEGLIKLWDSSICDLDEQQIFIAIKKMVCINEFPSITKFRRYALNIIDVEIAWDMREKHFLACEVWGQINKWDKQTKSEYDLKKMFESLYTIRSQQILVV